MVDGDLEAVWNNISMVCIFETHNGSPLSKFPSMITGLFNPNSFPEEDEVLNVLESYPPYNRQ